MMKLKFLIVILSLSLVSYSGIKNIEAQVPQKIELADRYIPIKNKKRKKEK